MRKNQVHWHELNMAGARVHENVMLSYIIIMCVRDLTEMHRFAFQQYFYDDPKWAHICCWTGLVSRFFH